MNQTPLFNAHESLGANMIEVDNWNLPQSYSTVTEEHNQVRNTCGIFDLCHLGQFWLSGHDALANLNKLCCQDAEFLCDRQICYSPMCNEEGKIIDDILIYRFEPNTFLLILNPGNIEKDYEWIKSHIEGDCHVSNQSSAIGTISLQGPSSESVLQKLTRQRLKPLRFYWFTTGKICGEDCIISRTGFTGEDGFEILFDSCHAEKIWNAIMEAGHDVGIKPIGLGARDTLRIDTRLVAYGKDLDETVTPIEANLNWTICFSKGFFIGSEALKKQRDENPRKLLVGFELPIGPTPKTGNKIFKDGKHVGRVTSASCSPTLKKNIGMAYVPWGMRNIGTKFDIEIRGKRYMATVAETPFYRK